jgi:hypothetical protein
VWVFVSRLSVRSGVSSVRFGMLFALKCCDSHQLTELRFPGMFENVGVAASAGVCVALMVGVSVFPTIVLQIKGRSFRPATE